MRKKITKKEQKFLNENIEPYYMKQHQEAMRLADIADQCKRNGYIFTKKEKLLEAFVLEQECALHLDNTNIEPSRSIFFRSAASLAFEAGLFNAANEMIKKGLTDKTPGGLRTDMDKLLKKIIKLERKSHNHIKFN